MQFFMLTSLPLNLIWSLRLICILTVLIRRRTQVAKGEVCKTFIHRFESDRCLIGHSYKCLYKAQVVEFGRHKGLKIPWTLCPCGFKSHPGQFKYITFFYINNIILVKFLNLNWLKMRVENYNTSIPAITASNIRP